MVEMRLGLVCRVELLALTGIPRGRGDAFVVTPALRVAADIVDDLALACGGQALVASGHWANRPRQEVQCM